MKKIITLLALAIIINVSVKAQSPQGFSYQGVARDTAGNILTSQPIGLKISILSGSSSGPVVYSETHAVTSDPYGVFELTIGSGTVVSGTFSGINWGSAIHFQKVEMDANGGTNYVFMGTSQLMSVPYALYALSSGTGTPGPTGAQGTTGANGLDGSTGPAGAQGTTGPTGVDGAAGIQGPTGANGLDGATGSMGADGAQGPTGANGIDGVTGAQGATGNNGADGAVGATGAQGATGNNGADGAVGATGTQGATGINGADGAVGPTGAQGATGNNGADGAVGTTGAQGATGNNGLDGAVGATGAQGTTGVVGTTGPAGAIGTTGANGIDAVGPIGSVIGWLKNLTGVPVLPIGWVECNGQVLSDAQSPLNGITIPNLNGSGGTTQMFLRGATTSGGTGGEDTHALTINEMPAHTHTITASGGVNGSNVTSAAGNTGMKTTNSTGGGLAHENRPPFYEVVWIIRVK